MEIKESNFKGLIPKDLIDAIKAKKCILFVGSGLSAQVKRKDGRPLPTWKNFLLELLDWAKSINVQFWGNPEDISDMIEKGNLLTAAQELQDRIDTPLINDFLASVLDDESVKPSETHCLLPNIPFRAILTTNYDTLIEGAYALIKSGKIPTVFTQEDLLTRPSPLHRDYFFIFKLHGHIDRPETIILGSRDYQDLLFRTPGYRQFLETLFSTHRVLFIGFGINDPDLVNIIDKLASIYSRTLDKHYVLLPTGNMNPTEMRRFASDKRLEIINYHKDQNHKQVYEFLRELIIQIKREDVEIEPYPSIGPDQVKVFISGSYLDLTSLMKIAEFLRENDYYPWLVYEVVKPGEPITQKISAAIEESDCIIVVLTNNSISSSWMELEIQFATSRSFDEKLVIIPIIIGDVKPPLYIMHRAYLRLKEKFQKGDLQPLLKSLSLIKQRKTIS